MKNNYLEKFILQQKEIYSIDGIFLPKNLNKTYPSKQEPVKDKSKNLFDKIRIEVSQCKKCELSKYRLNPVFGEGNINAKIMFVGEGPGYNEDRQGKPFVGRAGDLLTKIIEAMKFSRNDVYITNIVKCHPMKVNDPQLRNNDRPPNEVEINACIGYLYKQVEIISPKIICCLGSVAAKVITKNDLPISQLRGKVFNFPSNDKILVIPTYHPAALLRNPSLKKVVWEDMKLILKLLN
ncbi:MAG: uracil-DNA glycosylase [Endomicrobiia bacterium]